MTQKSSKFFHPFHLYNTFKFSCNYGSRILLKGMPLLGLRTYVFMLQTQTFQHKTIHKRRHEKKNPFLLMEHVSFYSELGKKSFKKNQNNGNSRRSKQGNNSLYKKELAVLLIIRCLSVLWGELLAKQNKCLEQTLDNKKGQSFCLFTVCFVFPASNMGSTVQTRVTCVSHLTRQVEG